MQVTIAGARVSKGWSQDELAQRMGVSRSTVVKWESGKVPMKPAYVCMFCNITGFDKDDLILPEEYTKRVQKE